MLTVLFDGVAYGMLLFVLACGLAVTLGVMNFINLAHGAFAMAGGYLAVALVNRAGVPFLAALPVVFVAVGVLGLAMERGVYRFVYARSHLDQVLFSIGLVFMASAAVDYTQGSSQQYVTIPDWLQARFVTPVASMGAYRILIIGICGLLVLGLHFILARTRFGARLRAAVDDPRTARGLGINVGAIFAVTFAVGSGLAGLGGALGAEILGLDPSFPLKYMVYFLIVVTVGGGAGIAGPFLAALLLGVGYGPTPPSGSRILARTAPPGHRTLIFSIKQAGAPAGGALAGLIVAPFALRFGWAPALLLAVVAGLGSAALIAPLRAMMDVERDPARSVHPRAIFSLANVMTPVRALTGGAEMVTITLLALSFALVQGVLFSFSVTYLTQSGLGLAEAGVVYACLQGAGVVARIFLGYLADRTGRPAANLTVQAVVAAGCVLAYAFMPMRLPLPVLAAVGMAAGFFGCSWNGIYMAEIARLAPPERVADAASGSTLVVFLGYVAGPSLFAAAVPVWGWHVPYAIAAGQLAAMAAVQGWRLWRAG